MNQRSDHQGKKARRPFGELDTGEKILRYTEGLSVPGKTPEKEAYARLRERMDKQVDAAGAKMPARPILYWSAAAAIVAILAVAALFSMRNRVSLVAGKGEHLEHRLPDGSLLTLNAASSIRYNSKDFIRERKIRLKGEAFLSVEPGTDFVIETPGFEITVLGTKLDIYAREDRFKVSCLEGRVRITGRQGGGTISGGEAIKLSAAGLVKEREPDVEKNASWKNGIYHFENTSLQSVFEEIERQFDVSVKAGGIDDRYFTGSFRGDSLGEVLETVCIPMELSYRFQGRGRILVNSTSR